jgi:hypothetical protein
MLVNDFWTHLKEIIVKKASKYVFIVKLTLISKKIKHFVLI